MATPQPDGPKQVVVRQIVIPWPSAESWRGWFLRFVLIVVVVYLAYAVREIWVPLTLAFLLATVLDPIVDRLEMRGWSRAVAASLIYAVFLIALGAAIAFSYNPVLAQLSDIQRGFAKEFPVTTPRGLSDSLKQHGIQSASVRTMLINVALGTAATFKSTARLSQYGLTIVTNVIWIVIVPIIAYYALRDYHVILAKALLLVPKERREVVQTAVAETTAIFAKYLRGMAIVSLLNGLATWVLLYAFGIPSALVIAIAATILYNVPYLGAIAINTLIAAVSFLHHGNLQEMYLITGIGLVLHNIVFDQIIAPRILGGHVGLHPILSIIALLVGNLLLGIVGMILAVPVAACIQIGVLALIPKLRHEIEIPAEPSHPGAGTSVHEIEEEFAETQVKTDATEELHRSVNAAVDNIEEKMVEAEAEDLAETERKAAESSTPTP